MAVHLKTQHHFAYVAIQAQAPPAKSKSSGAGDATSATATAVALEVEEEDDSSTSTGNISTVNLYLPSTSSSTSHSQQRQEVGDHDSPGPAETEAVPLMAEKESSPLPVLGTKRRRQPTLAACLEQSSSFGEGGQKHKEIRQSLLYMICKDNLPLSCVEKKGMQKFVHTLCPLYRMPSRKKVTHLVEGKYEAIKTIFAKFLDKENFFSFTSDILTITNSTRSFLVLTVHLLKC